ncbi:MAG: metallophosphoesterase [Polaromonas sp.]
MTRLLQISDLHFGTEQPDVMAALRALSGGKKPDVLVVSGDITQRATAEQFKNAKAFCDSLSIAPMISLPGNHDIPLFNLFARVLHPYAAYQKAFGQILEQALITPALCLITVNTTRWWRHKNGEVSTAQIDRVCQQLARATPQQLRVVVVHQPVHVLRPQDEHDRLRGWQPAVSAWAAAGADIVMGGHIHLPYVCELSSTVKGLARRMWCVQAGTAVSSRIRREAPNSVNLLEFANDGDVLRCSVERWDYQKAGSTFELAHTSVLNLQRQASL